MADFKFSPAPAERGGESPVTPCPMSWHPTFHAPEVEQFHGGWKRKTCPRCRWEAINTGEKSSPEHREAVETAAADALNRRLFATGIQPRFRHATFDTYQVGSVADPKYKARAACLEYAEQFERNSREGRGLLLLGNVGTGKTHLAGAIAQFVVREHESWAVVTTAAEICRVMRGSYSKGAGYTEADVLEELASSDLLVIDEIGVQSGTDYAPGVLSDVIDRRYQRMLPTVLISNRLANELAQFIGDRALDRMRQGGKVVSFPWASARGEA